MRRTTSQSFTVSLLAYLYGQGVMPHPSGSGEKEFLLISRYFLGIGESIPVALIPQKNGGHETSLFFAAPHRRWKMSSYNIMGYFCD
jgi:hypothetical protein